MAARNASVEAEPAVDGERFDPTALISKRPSSVPTIYEAIVDGDGISPKEIGARIDASQSVVYTNVRTLLDHGLIAKVERGIYRPADIALDSAVLSNLGDLRSTRQYELCRVASEYAELDAATIADRLEMSRSNGRKTAQYLESGGFLSTRRVAYSRSRERFRLTVEADRALRTLEIDRYLGRDRRASVAHESGIEGTAFRTPYEVEDAHYLTAAEGTWFHPCSVARALDKNEKKTRVRFSKMAERGLLERTEEEHKLLFAATEKTRSMVAELDLYAISRQRDLDLYGVAKEQRVPGRFTIDDLYSALASNGGSVTVCEVHNARDALKRAGLLVGDRLSGYSFVLN
jgi:DNA-binding MarR family transcriptional regulator